VLKYLTKLHQIGIDGSQESPKIVYDSRGVESRPPLSGLADMASVTTLSLMWIFGKRAFSVSGGLLDLITSLRNSNSMASLRRGQVDLEGNPVWVWSLVGFWGGKLGKNDWSVDLNLKQFRKLRSSDSWTDAEREPPFDPVDVGIFTKELGFL
jgi:hypothetical protein